MLPDLRDGIAFWKLYRLRPRRMCVEHNGITETRYDQVLGETPLSVTLSITHPTWTYLGSIPGLRGEKQANNCLRHGGGGDSSGH